MSLQIHQHQTNRAAWLALCVAGALLITLSVPGLTAQFYAQPSSTIVHKVSQGEKGVTIERLRETLQGLQLATAYEPGRRQLWNSKATIVLRLYEDSLSGEDAEISKDILTRAQQDIILTLRSAPGDSNLWYLLSEVRAKLHVADPQTFDYLTMSYLTGPREGWVAYRRLQLSLRLWPFLGEDTRRYAKREILTLWSTTPLQRELAGVFINTTVLGKRIISQEIKDRGAAEFSRFEAAIKRRGWKGDLKRFL